MNIVIRAEIIEEIENMVPFEVNQDELSEVIDWLLCVGLGSSKAALEEHPELSFDELIIQSVKNNSID